ncbi:MAG: N-acetylmuramoyl-L-alanine amidase [Cyanobacteria bacterium NC_groundwater_1444_Ag_S-0.65um_54_12]|nr:N-acetylmuramoyl-L-alanine amidase [Cyanobacteria bacterium NC_groundwater_1444_Ag_S-0.65um_54_12]
MAYLGILATASPLPVAPATASILQSNSIRSVVSQIVWREGKLEITANGPLRFRQAAFHAPERYVVDLLDAEISTQLPNVMTLPVNDGSVQQVRVAFHPETVSLRIVLDLAQATVCQIEQLSAGQQLSIKARHSIISQLIGPPVPDLIGPPVLELIGPPAPELIGPPVLDLIGPPAPELIGPPATPSQPWPDHLQVVERLQLRHTNKETLLEIQAAAPLLVWLQQDLTAARLTIRVPHAALLCQPPLPGGAVRRFTLRREPEVWALTLDLAEKLYVFSTESQEAGRLLRLRISPQTISASDRPLVIVDAGHGGYDPGAIGIGGRQESQLVLQVAERLRLALAEKGIAAVLTRTIDAEISLAERLALIGRLPTLALISLHCNSSPFPEVSGIETYFRQPNSQLLAKTILGRLVQASGSSDRGVRQGQLFVLQHEEVPSSLVELGFLSNAKEEARLADPDYQVLLARAIANGILDFLDQQPLGKTLGSRNRSLPRKS